MTSERTLILGATKGLGKAIADQCAERGQKTLELGSSVINTHMDSHTRARLQLRCDLASAAEAERSALSLVAQFCITRFYWVGGTLLQGKLDEQKLEDVLRTVDVNFRNPLIIAQTVWRDMKRDRRHEHPSCFSVIASSSGIKARDNQAIYAATKHAQVGFTRSLGLENANPRIKVSLFLPGGMRTELWKDHPNPAYDGFMDPVKVAARMVSLVEDQPEPYLEQAFDRAKDTDLL